MTLFKTFIGILACSVCVVLVAIFWVPDVDVSGPSDATFAQPGSGWSLHNTFFSTNRLLLDANGPPARQKEDTAVDTHALIRAAARKHRVPVGLVKSIVAAESNFNLNALSRKGAIGLMQLMPNTAAEFGADPHIPEQNVDAGTHYLRVLMDRYERHNDSLKRVIAAYNAGPRMVDRYRGVPPFRETRGYVARVLQLLRRFEKDNV